MFSYEYSNLRDLIQLIQFHRDFREETSLKSRFLLRILYILLRSLRLGQASSSATTLEECTKAAQTFQAIVTKEVLQHDDKAGLLTYVVFLILLLYTSLLSFPLALILTFHLFHSATILIHQHPPFVLLSRVSFHQ